MDPNGLAGAPVLFTLMDLRDIVVIVWGILSIILLLTLALAVLILTLSVKRLIAEVNDLLNSGVKPVLVSARESADNVAGTTRFIGDKAVAPIIRVLGLVSGVRRGLSVFAGLTGHGKGRGIES